MLFLRQLFVYGNDKSTLELNMNTVNINMFVNKPEVQWCLSDASLHTGSVDVLQLAIMLVV